MQEATLNAGDGAAPNSCTPDPTLARRTHQGALRCDGARAKAAVGAASPSAR